MKKIEATVILGIYNEELLIQRALESVKNFGQIIVIHDGPCKDKSLEIAKKYTTEIYEMEKNLGAVDYHRIFGLSKSIFDWVFILDADEYLSSELISEIPSLIKDSSVAIYDIAWPIWDGRKDHFGSYKRVLFNKNCVYFIECLNEYVRLKDQSKLIKTVNLPLWHRPLYVNVSRNTFFTKQKKWAKLQARDLKKSFSDVCTWNFNGNGWEKEYSYRMKFPIILGILGSFFFLFIKGCFLSIKNRDVYFIKVYLYLGIFESLVWFYYINSQFND